MTLTQKMWNNNVTECLLITPITSSPGHWKTHYPLRRNCTCPDYVDLRYALTYGTHKPQYAWLPNELCC